MAQYKCVDCGTVFEGTLDSCPNCGCPKSDCKVCNTFQPLVAQQIAYSNPQVTQRDHAHYVYECAALFWNTLTQRYCSFSGRASRREFWSFILVLCTIPFLLFGAFPIAGIIDLICIIPFIGVWVRRMHDINKSGWWGLCPIVCFFLALKRSDEGRNDYGEPMDYSEILSLS